MDIKVSGRKVTVTDALRARVNEKVGTAVRVFDIKPMTCDVVLRVEESHARDDFAVCEVTVRVRDSVVRVESSSPDMYAAIDAAAKKVTRQLRKFKTKVVDRRQRARGLPVEPMPANVADLIEPEPVEPEDDDELVREKVIDLPPMTEEEALIQTDLLGHDFYVFTNVETGLVNVIYHRRDGGYGIIKPRVSGADE